MSEYILNEQQVMAIRADVVETAERMLSGKVNFLEGARKLAALRHEAAVKEDDPDFGIFVGIASESDDFPLGSVREEWSPEALRRLQPEIDRVATWARESGGDAACRSLIDRFDAACRSLIDRFDA